jgi:hypothetical protein
MCIWKTSAEYEETGHFQQPSFSGSNVEHYTEKRYWFTRGRQGGTARPNWPLGIPR